MPSPNLSEIITSTLRDRSGKTADNVSKGNPLLMKMKAAGGWDTAEGRTIIQELEYAEGNFQWYSGYETFTISPADVLSGAEFDWKQAVATVSISGLERDVQNVGQAQVIKLLSARMKNAEHTLKNNITIGLYSDGTGTGGKQLGGLQLIVADTPTTGTVGGINRATATNAFWRNQAYDATTDGGAAATAANIQKYMNTMLLRCTRGTDRPTMITADSAYYNLYWQSLQAIQRITSADDAKAGFTALSYANNIPVYYEDSTGIPANHMYFLNTDYLKLRYAASRLFSPGEGVRPSNQDAETVPVYFAGNLTCSNCSLQGVLKD